VKVYVEAQEHDPDHESPDTEQVHAQSSYSERKKKGVIHIPHQLQKYSMDIQPKYDREEGTTYQYPLGLSQTYRYSFS